MIPKATRSYSTLFSGYTELRFQENRTITITLVDGTVLNNNRSATSGVSARVYHRGSWGFASNSRYSDEQVRLVIREATENAAFLAARRRKKPAIASGRGAVFDKDFSTTRPRLSQKQLIAFLKEIDEHIRQTCPKLISRTVVCAALDMEKSLLTSENCQSYSLIPRTLLVTSMSVEQAGQPVELLEIQGGFGQVEDHFGDPASFYPAIDSQYQHLLNKAEGLYPEAGSRECILDSRLAGILAHEAIGHTTEADVVLGGSIAAHYLNREVASPLVSMIDFAHHAGDRLCPVPVFVDDEGVEAEDALLIDQGTLRSYMHNRESAAHFGARPAGNARAYGFSDEPLIRMRNTAILPGQSKLEDMIGSIEDGYYLMRSRNGQADSTSEFMFAITLGYEIKKGRLGKAIRDTTISGVAFDMLKTVTMTSDEMYWACWGLCGKKQRIPVGFGGPAVKCTVKVGGQ